MHGGGGERERKLSNASYTCKAITQISVEIKPLIHVRIKLSVKLV